MMSCVIWCDWLQLSWYLPGYGQHIHSDRNDPRRWWWKQKKMIRRTQWNRLWALQLYI